MTESQTDPDLLYVGTYTEGTKSEGVYLVRMDRRSGELLRVGSVNAGANPSFLSIHPNRPVLYAVNELERGAVSAFSIDKGSGALTRLNEQPSEGGAPCYVSAHGKRSECRASGSAARALHPARSHEPLRARRGPGRRSRVRLPARSRRSNAAACRER